MRANQAFPERAVDVIAARCMKKAGAPFEPLPAEGYVPSGIPRPYGIDVETASETGYWEIASVERGVDAAEHSTDQVSQAVRDKIDEALYGPEGGPENTFTDSLTGGTVGSPTSGCLAEGRKAVYGDLKSFFQNQFFAGNFVSTVLGYAAEDPERVRLDEEWSECMGKAGFGDFDSPDEALAKSVADIDGGGAAAYASTVEVAVADATCEESLGYAAKREKLEDRYLSAGVIKFEAQIQASREMYDSAAKRAQRAIQEVS